MFRKIKNFKSFGGFIMKTGKSLLILTLVLFIGIGSSQTLLADPPTAGLKLWLKADAGILKLDTSTMDPNDYIAALDGDTIDRWADQSGNANDAIWASGTPKLLTVGSQKAVRFDGISWFALMDTPGMRLSNLSIYAVVDMDPGSQGQTFFGNFDNVSGFALGTNDGVANAVKWFTADDWNGSSTEPATLLPADPDRYTIINATYLSTETLLKTVYFDGTNVARGTGTGLTYYNTTTAAVGALTAAGWQAATGNVSEILVYDTDSRAQYQAVHAYLGQKYGITVADDYQYPTCAELTRFYVTDLNQDCYVNLEDFALLAAKWLKCNDPENENCTWPIE